VFKVNKDFKEFLVFRVNKGHKDHRESKGYRGYKVLLDSHLPTNGSVHSCASRTRMDPGGTSQI